MCNISSEIYSFIYILDDEMDVLVKILDKKRFEKHIGVVDQEEFKIIKKLLKELLL